LSEYVHDANCIVCRARSAAPYRAIQALFALGGITLVALGIAVLRPQAVTQRGSHAEARAETHQALRTHELRGAPAQATVTDLAAESRAASEIGAYAARGFDRSFFFSSPGGLDASAARVASWKPLIVRAARGSGISPNLLEGMVFVESSGRSAVTSGDHAGLTQLSTARARSLGLAPRLRFHPRAELRATVRYLVRARQVLGRTDLAVASYHLGVRHLAFAQRRPYAALYFGSDFSRLGAQRDYYWKVLAAERILHVFRHDRAALSYEAYLQARKNSAEEVLHPQSTTPQFRTPNAILRAWQHHVVVPIPLDARATHIAVSGTLGQEARRLGRSRRLYRALRPAALDVLLYIGQEVHALSGARRPLVLTSAVRDDRYQRVLTSVNYNATHSYSMHTTGYAFDIAREYGSLREARAFQTVLDKLAAVDAIAYIREAEAMHIAVASDAARKLALLRAE
jgi:soluble lytic murein transglycosylase-like protein